MQDGFALIKPGQTYVGKQGFTYGAGRLERDRRRDEGLHERAADAAGRGCESALP